MTSHVQGFPVAHRTEPVDLEAVDGHGTCGQLDLFARADPRVGAFPVDLDGADAAGNLFNFPGQRGDAGPDRFLRYRGGAAGGGDLTLGVVGDS